MANTADWEYKTGDMGGYVACSSCGRKFSAKEFLFADVVTSTCPKCGAEMRFQKLDYEEIELEALHDRR